MAPIKPMTTEDFPGTPTPSESPNQQPPQTPKPQPPPPAQKR